MNILIIKLGAIGDVLRTTSVLQALKEKYPDCEISWVTKNKSFDILKNNDFIDKIHLSDENLKEKLKGKIFDLIISLDDDSESCDLASSLNSKKIIGAYLENGKRVYTEDSALWFDIGLISKFGKEKADELKALNKKTHQEILFNILNINNGKYKICRPILNLQKEDLKFAKQFAEKNNIGKKDLVIGINTGAGGRWQDKKLPIEKTIELIDKLNSELKVKLILFGGPAEIERNKKIKQGIKTDIIDAGCNNSLMEFASLINLCKILITSDSLALHIGIALKRKIVAFFYVTSAAEIELYNRGIKVIGKGDSYCSYQPVCDDPPDYNINEIIEGVKKLMNFGK
ncbi:MAG: glycosyltransferase family 9 protein [Nanoarchaeota archaeon]|nr:glycosyltransferase family 9 protein [Nanoarchaeota archaeon]